MTYPPVWDQSWNWFLELDGARRAWLADQNHPLMFLGSKSGRSQPSKLQSLPEVQMYLTPKKIICRFWYLYKMLSLTLVIYQNEFVNIQNNLTYHSWIPWPSYILVRFRSWPSPCNVFYSSFWHWTNPTFGWPKQGLAKRTSSCGYRNVGYLVCLLLKLKIIISISIL